MRDAEFNRLRGGIRGPACARPHRHLLCATGIALRTTAGALVQLYLADRVLGARGNLRVRQNDAGPRGDR